MATSRELVIEESTPLSLPASPQALAAIRQAIGLEADAPIDLDLIYARGFFGTEADRERLLSVCRPPPGQDLTLDRLANALIVAEKKQEQASKRLSELSQTPAMDFERAAELLLALCSYDVRTKWVKVSQEVRVDLPIPELLAGVINTYGNSMAYADFSQVQSRDEAAMLVGIDSPGLMPTVTHQLLTPTRGIGAKIPLVCPATVTFTERSGDASKTETYPFCGKAFTPVDPARKPTYGCTACGKWAWALQKHVGKYAKALENRLESRFVEPLPTLIQQEAIWGKCTCGS